MAQLKVIRASAGSGKTWRITHEYLSWVIRDPDSFSHILAVTFTNKATEEMKGRIIRELHNLASGRDSKHLEGLIKEMRKDEAWLRRQSRLVLHRMLHQYSRFSVSTIDSFFQSIIRSFTRELGIQSGYSIEVDMKMLVPELVDRLLEEAGKDGKLLEWLTRFSEAQVERGDNWNFREKINLLGEEIFKETYGMVADADNLAGRGREVLLPLQQSLGNLRIKLEKEYAAIGRQAADAIEKHGLQVDDFKGKTRGPAGFLCRLSGGGFIKPTQTAAEAAEDESSWVILKAPNRERALHLAKQVLMPLMKQALKLYHDNGRDYHTATEALRNLFTLGILTDLSRHAGEWCNENNAFLLPEAPNFLHRIIRENDSPFIYEKTGSWYNHFMIDEFQDTSELQWENFKPLISNSLSVDCDNLVVGDVKQSVYRWRNSNWEILASRISGDFEGQWLSHDNLPYNRRSGRRLVAFNNSFFHHAAGILEEDFRRLAVEAGAVATGTSPAITGIYSDVMQLSPGEISTEGYVQIQFIPNGNAITFERETNSRLLACIGDLMKRGYAMNRMAVITRTNREARKLAEFLLSTSTKDAGLPRPLDVISDEALCLGNSPVISFLAALLRYLVYPDDSINKYFLWREYRHRFGISDAFAPAEGGSEISPQEGDLSVTWQQNFEQCMPRELVEFTSAFPSSSLPETVSRLSGIFNLGKHAGERIYLQAFMDLVLEYSHNATPDLARFVDWWEVAGRKRSVSAPFTQDAIRILTIHKAKGLEFDVVMIPYCDWDMKPGRNTILWCSYPGPPYDRIKALPLNFSENLRETHFRDAYLDELRRLAVDNLNLLYVAFTRAKSEMYAWCGAKASENTATIGGLMRRVMACKREPEMENRPTMDLASFFDAAAGTFACGRKQHEPAAAKDDDGSHVAFTPLPPAPSGGGRLMPQGLRMAFQGRMNLEATEGTICRPLSEGILMHEIFSHIRTLNDLAPAMDRMVLEGKMELRSRDRLERAVRDRMNNVVVMSWYGGDWQVVSEGEIIIPGGMVRRPDRVLVREGRAIVIDFKFGEKESRHHEQQVREYAQLIRAMGYGETEAFLWYVMEGTIRKVV